MRNRPSAADLKLKRQLSCGLGIGTQAAHQPTSLYGGAAMVLCCGIYMTGVVL